jgi:hypothetical protein
MGSGDILNSMTASRAAHHEAISAEDIFCLRCWARATLFAAGEFDLHAAVDVLQEDAERSGLIEQCGQDFVQRMMADAFHSVHGIEQQPFHVKQFSKTVDKNLSDAKSVLPVSTVRAVEFLIQQNDPKRLRSWLAKHTRAERLAIKNYFNGRQA